MIDLEVQGMPGSARAAHRLRIHPAAQSWSVPRAGAETSTIGYTLTGGSRGLLATSGSDPTSTTTIPVFWPVST